MVSKLDASRNASETMPPSTNQELFALANFFFGQTREALNRLIRLPGPTGERSKSIVALRNELNSYEEILEKIKIRKAADAQKQLDAIESELKSARERLERQTEDARTLTVRMKDDESVRGALEETRREISKIKDEIIPAIEGDKVRKMAEIEKIVLSDLSKPPDSETIKLLDEVESFVSTVGNLETEQRQGNAIDEGVENDFAEKADEFKHAIERHEKHAFYTLVIMGGLIVAGAVAIGWLFGNLKVECVGEFTGQIETLAIVERLVLTGVGRVAVLALVAWSLAYTGSLHRSHSEQAVLYRDKKAALGVITNLMRAATPLQQKHDLLQSIARGYLGFDQNAFRSSHDSSRGRRNKKSRAASQIKELADATAPLVDVLSKLRK